MCLPYTQIRYMYVTWRTLCWPPIKKKTVHDLLCTSGCFHLFKCAPPHCGCSTYHVFITYGNYVRSQLLLKKIRKQILILFLRFNDYLTDEWWQFWLCRMIFSPYWNAIIKIYLAELFLTCLKEKARKKERTRKKLKKKYSLYWNVIYCIFVPARNRVENTYVFTW